MQKELELVTPTPFDFYGLFEVQTLAPAWLPARELNRALEESGHWIGIPADPETGVWGFLNTSDGKVADASAWLELANVLATRLLPQAVRLQAPRLLGAQERVRLARTLRNGGENLTCARILVELKPLGSPTWLAEFWVFALSPAQGVA